MKIVITGGAGFIGTNTCKYYLDRGDEVVLFDNLSRSGSRKNLVWLKEQQGKLLVLEGDVRNEKDISELQKHLYNAAAVIHLAGQVAVTTSVVDPRTDFDINALGTFNVLEAMRQVSSNALFIYSSTNKVYGGMEDVGVDEGATRYEYKNLPFGVSEQQPLDFHSPYGCSKGTADQYVHDYHRIYGLNTVVFRQSCIYGSHQFGVEDQGWVAWFIIAKTLNKPLSIYGNGKQVRDLLHVDDLIRAYDSALIHKAKTVGNVYNIGGGKDNTLSVWLEFCPLLEKLFQRKIDVTFADWRPGDQPIFVADIRKAKREFSWEPKISVQSGVENLFHWVQKNSDLFSS
ncbi:SDR family NAD(P)-dependent oxidoreductase [Candidatus Gottesmanbacteria bacterium]|nr:SDR family NAD(P)-dependent oxidoreductase [Candidatus Gottesmanbacteria bacterium]